MGIPCQLRQQAINPVCALHSEGIPCSCRFHYSLRGRDWPATLWRRMLRLPHMHSAVWMAERFQPRNKSFGIAVASSQQGQVDRQGDGFGACAAVYVFDQRNSWPVVHIACIVTASLRATATMAFFMLPSLAIRRPQA